ncbi:hypothetical protein D5086_003204 [Populus alba]|uniref:Uncharacterized protein n=1 Tax=Populus alba TaxID=43335 RepID=A0ACC4D4H9_POPAL
MSKRVPNASSSLPKADYEKMEAEWKLDLLRKEYALDEKRASAMGAYLLAVKLKQSLRSRPCVVFCKLS